MHKERKTAKETFVLIKTGFPFPEREFAVEKHFFKTGLTFLSVLTNISFLKIAFGTVYSTCILRLLNSTGMCVICANKSCVAFLLHKMGMPVQLVILLSFPLLMRSGGQGGVGWGDESVLRLWVFILIHFY